MTNSTVKIRFDELKVHLSNYEKHFHEEAGTRVQPETELDKLSAKELKNMLTGRRRDYEKVEDVKVAMETKGHVLSSAQSRLIRKMSIHAGEKLTLREAQLLANKLKKKL